MLHMAFSGTVFESCDLGITIIKFYLRSGGEQISRLVGYIGGKANNKPMGNNASMGMNRFMFDEKLQDPTKDANGQCVM